MKKNKFVTGILILSIMILLFLLVLNFRFSYKPFIWEADECINYYEECLCLGFLEFRDSYPPDYLCTGIELCKDINVTECPED